MTKATPKAVRAALAREFVDIEFYRSPAGYYYFSGTNGVFMPSIYTFNLDGYTVDEIMGHARQHAPDKAKRNA